MPLIVIEGLDGAGKSTQVKKLKRYLSDRFGEIRYLHFPRYDAPVTGEMISRFLRGDYGNIGDVHPQIVALLFAEDRRDASPLVRGWLSQKDIVLLDRYVYSNIAYQCAKLKSAEERDNLMEWILDTEYSEFHVPRPDLNIFLDVPVSFVQERLSEDRNGNERSYLNGMKDIHEDNIGFQMAVRDMYVKLTENDPDFIRLDCSDENGNMASPETIFERIRAVVDSKIG